MLSQNIEKYKQLQYLIRIRKSLKLVMLRLS
jgi:hypothetical protein